MDNQIHKNTGLRYALLHFYLYSSLHIAICAVAITAFSYLSLGKINYGYVGFVGASTLLLYSVHRIIGINKSDSYATQGRFAIIIKYKSHLIIYSIVSALYCLYSYYTFDWNRRFLLVIPAVLSLSYSLPIFFGGKRLRDFHWIKIFLVAICWAVITGSIPFYETISSFGDTPYNYGMLLLVTLERAMFIFAITIPFDIRDRDIDKSTNVLTLATKLSDKVLKSISGFALIGASAISIILYTQQLYDIRITTVILLTYSITALAIFITHGRRSDYFFTGLMDGTMMLPLILVMLFAIFVHIFGFLVGI